MSNIVIQSEVDNSSVPDSEIISDWAFAVLKQLDDDQRELTIRIVDQQEMTSLNESYRGKPGVTNVLSFPFENPPGIDAGIIGDIAICADVVGNEAAEQDKSALSHWAHMVVHGTLHLKGYDHVQEDQAVEMERLEIRLLSDLGFPNPYSSDRVSNDTVVVI